MLQEHDAPPPTFGALIRNPAILVLTIVYFTLACGAMAISFWLPIMIHSATSDSLLMTGILSAIPHVVGMFGVVLIARNSDKHNERRLHYAACVISAGIAMGALPFFEGNLAAILVLLSIGATGTFAAFPIFWSIPHRYLGRQTAAAGLAFVSCLGQIGGFVSPATIGWIRATTGRMDLGLYALCAVMITGGLLLMQVLQRNIPDTAGILPDVSSK